MNTETGPKSRRSGLAIMWFRRDLRLADNPALVAAAEYEQVLPLWIDDADEAGEMALGAAHRAWQAKALETLDHAMDGHLTMFKGPAAEVFDDLLQRHDVRAVFWNRCYEPWRIARDTEIKTKLKSDGHQVESFNGSVLWEPWTIRKGDGTPYKVFTPFFRKGCRAALEPRLPLATPDGVNWCGDELGVSVQELDMVPRLPWGAEMMAHWSVGEDAAQAQLDLFLDEGLSNYKEGRNFPAETHVSRLSPYLSSGEISPNQIWHSTKRAMDDANTDHFKSELGWREFSYGLLSEHSDLCRRNLQSKFDDFPWCDDPEGLAAWQKGQTGIPLVDAGMRELWSTGYMHNRVRMVAASFLVKNLMVDWRHGEAWFRDTLVDADPASNAASWQWVAGSGADAAPYFRIFNPVTQGAKFDPDGIYIRKWVPEIAGLQGKHIFDPSAAPDPILRAAGVTLGETYPQRIVDLKTSRQRALDAFASLKGRVD